MTAPNSMSLKSWLLLALLSLIWGTSFLMIEVALTELPPFTIVTFRVGLAAIALFAFMKATGRPLPRGKSIWISLFIMGLLNNAVPFSFLVWGQTQISSGLAAILNATTPMFTVVMAHYFTVDEKVTPHKLVGILAGFLGIAVIFTPTISSDMTSSFLGQLALIACSFSYALAVIYGKRFARLGIQPLDIAFGQLVMSTTIMIPVALIFEQAYSLPMPSGDVILSLLGLSVLNSAIAYIIYFKLIASAGATNASLVTITIPPVAILLGIFFLQEEFLTEHAIGLILIALGLIIVDGRIVKSFTSPRAKPNKL